MRGNFSTNSVKHNLQESFCWLNRKEREGISHLHTAISSKVVGKSARDNPERCCGWFWVHSVLRRNLKEWHEGPRTYVFECYRKAANVGSTATLFVRNTVLTISHITSRDCRVHVFSDNLSRKSCIADSIKAALGLGIGSCALGSNCLVVTQVNHCIVPYAQLPKQPFLI